jgi:hypothetical protein
MAGGYAYCKSSCAYARAPLTPAALRKLMLYECVAFFEVPGVVELGKWRPAAAEPVALTAAALIAY